MAYRPTPPAPPLDSWWARTWALVRWYARQPVLPGSSDVVALMLMAVFSVALPVTLVELSGCTGAAVAVEAQTASGIAVAANAALPMLVERYRSEGVAVIEGVKAAGGTADDARAAIETVKAKWAPVWKAWDALAIAQNEWATALQAGGDTAGAVGALKGAYCSLLFLWPKDVPVVPLAPVQCGEVKP